MRESKVPERFYIYLAMVTTISEYEPSYFEHAADEHVYRDAMVEEYASIMKNDIWEVVFRPKGKSLVTSKWFYKIKYVLDGSIEKYKARFLVRGSHR